MKKDQETAKKEHQSPPPDPKQPEVEAEDLGIPRIVNPYDPEKIKVNQETVNLGSLIEMLEEEEIDLMPEFQRSMDLWDDVKESQLIESLLLGLPLPSFYFSVDGKTGKWLVVDGLQRLCTFNDFLVKKKLALTGLEFLDTYEGKTFNDLGKPDRRKISGAKITQYIIDKQTPSNVTFLIFKRVNTGGLVLTPQEIRHALNQGVSSTFVKELAELEAFKQATGYQIRTKRMEDRDFVNRFIAFYTLDYETHYDGEMDKYLNDAMERLETLSDSERTQIKDAFQKSMTLSYEMFGSDAFRKQYHDSDTRNPISKAVFDTISVNLAKLSDKQRETLRSRKKRLITGLIDLFKQGAVHHSITTATGQKNKIRIRFNAIKELIQTILKS